jgi:glycosyltransferase involved in cell wall biosynthesis
MASGTAVVTTDCGGIRDYAINDYNSLITPPGNPSAIAEAVIRVLNDQRLREALIQNGLETAKQWTWDRVTDKFEKVIKEDIAR